LDLRIRRMRSPKQFLPPPLMNLIFVLVDSFTGPVLSTQELILVKKGAFYEKNCQNNVCVLHIQEWRRG
jgi:hypothetical protein